MKYNSIELIGSFRRGVTELANRRVNETVKEFE